MPFKRCLVFCLFLASSWAFGATLLVTQAGDDGIGSLRYAVSNAVAGDTITFDSTLIGQTITLTSGVVRVGSGISILGPGANRLTVYRSTLAPFLSTGVLTFLGSNVLSGLTIKSAGSGIGGANFTVIDCNIVECLGIFAVSGEGIKMLGCSIARNHQLAFYQIYGENELVNCTFEANRRGAIQMGAENGGLLKLHNCTITRNGGIVEGSLFSFRTAMKWNGGNVDFKNTILAGNNADYDLYIKEEPRGPTASSGHNLFGRVLDDVGGIEFSPSDRFYVSDVDLRLEPLLENRGGTLTAALGAGSIAIDAGGDADAPGTDQRGVPRPQGIRADIGACEFTFGTARPQTNRTIRVEFSAVPGRSYWLEMSDDVDGWTRLTNATANPNGVVNFDCENIGPKRFFRTVEE